MIRIKTLLGSFKFRLAAQLVVILTLLLTYGAYSFYQVHLRQVTLEQRIQGMTEYEVCQLAFEEFGMNMVKDMGCLDHMEANTDMREHREMKELRN